MKVVFLFAAGLAIFPLAAVGAPATFALSGHFEGKVYQVDTVFNNIDVIMPDRKRTFWADGSSRVRAHGKSAQLIDIAMGDEVRGTYVTGAKGALRLVSIEDLTER